MTMPTTPTHCGQQMEILVMSSGVRDTAIVWQCRCGSKVGGRINNLTGAVSLSTSEYEE